MELDLIKFNDLLDDIMKNKYLEENLHRILKEIGKEVSYQSLGIYLHSSSENIYRLKIGRNLSHTFSKKVVFLDDCDFIYSLCDLNVKNICDVKDCKFDKEYSNLIIIPLHNNNSLLGFLFLDKASGTFSDSEINKVKIFSSIISLGINLNELREEVDRTKSIDDIVHIYTFKAFKERSDFVFSLMKRHQKPLVMTIFKINTLDKLIGTFGKQKINETFAEIGLILERFLRTTDLAGKLNIETFAILMPETPIENAELVIRRIDKLICDLDVFSNQKIGWGIAKLDEKIVDLHHLIHNAEEACFEAIRKYDDNISIYIEK
jgi:diguanylate cyclase (GGDEF)-like protein